MIKDRIKELAGLSLEHAGIRSEYSDEDMADVCIIFQEVFMNRMYEHVGPISALSVAEDAGSELKEYIEKYTGINLHQVYKD